LSQNAGKSRSASFVYNNIEILTFIIVIPSHQAIDSYDPASGNGGLRKLAWERTSELPIREGTKARAGKLAWRDSVGKVVPGPLTVLPLQESLGKRERKKKKKWKKMGVSETYLMERRILGEGTGMEESGKEISMREYPVGRGQDNRTAAVADSI
jgi:hypothetical protein